MEPCITTDMTVLDSLLALNLSVNIWSARKKLCPEDFGGAELPPDDLASLGSKRIADPEGLKVFSALKSRAVSLLDRNGVRFLSGWAIPEDKAGDIVRELVAIRDAFLAEKDRFLASYDTSIQQWIARHSQWAGIIANSTVGGDYVRSRLGFAWQMYKVAPLMEHAEPGAVLEAGLAEAVQNLAGTLFGEIARDADSIWKNVYAGRDSVTHKALSPLRTLYNKLMGLTFVEPHVAPLARIIHTALDGVPAKGNITGAALVTLQGVVALLRDPAAMLSHSQRLLEGTSPDFVLEAMASVPVPPLAQPHANIPSMGLW